ncbi:ly6/PLAUR domain-containing protein 3 [Chiroxiphia lanceolata]|uniref:ly6/PLAUR domain-containing protein 3 n=1 Tax=Chiroxiphia lanceolata TaxID=296741 RepID=UPI0013CE40E9|nr:ly6/PLAUR domain-containing protein 3 [Chiroxiphia lanceolata]XP_032533531.1 ly6/PLAUR domain-containing protein 3 [Chiroxiphia lanceolata]
MWREVRGCVRDGSCTQEWRGDDAASLSGSCCAGDLCNRHPLSNKTLFDPDPAPPRAPPPRPRPHGHAKSGRQRHPPGRPRHTERHRANRRGSALAVPWAPVTGAATGHPDVAALDPSVASGGRRATGDG